MYDPEKHLSIKYWADDDRPREKLLLKGRGTLSVTELLAIILGSGTRNQSAIDLSKSILRAADNDLNNLARFGVKDLEKIKGVGPAKAVAIVSAFELARRRSENGFQEKPSITSSGKAYQMVKDSLSDLPHEEFWIILLNRKNSVIQIRKISSGGVAGTVVDPKMIFKSALEVLASGIILVHNHPSGSSKPSTEDLEITKSLVKGGNILSIKILDHLIIAGDSYFSFMDEGIL